MKTQSPDTNPKVEKFLIDAYRNMPAWKKLQCIDDMNQFLRELALSDIRERYPDADEHEIKMRLASRWLEPELMRKVYHWDPDEKGY